MVEKASVIPSHFGTYTSGIVVDAKSIQISASNDCGAEDCLGETEYIGHDSDMENPPLLP